MALAEAYEIDRPVTDFSAAKKGLAWKLVPDDIKQDWLDNGLIAYFVADEDFLDIGGDAPAGSDFRWRSVFGNYNLRIASSQTDSSQTFLAEPSAHFGNLPAVQNSGTSGSSDARLIMYDGAGASPAAVIPNDGDWRVDMLTYMTDTNCHIMGHPSSTTSLSANRVGGEIRLALGTSGYGIALSPALAPAFSPGSVDLLLSMRRRADNRFQIDYCRATDADWIPYDGDEVPLVTVDGGSTKRGNGTGLAFWDFRTAQSQYGGDQITRIIDVWNKDPTDAGPLPTKTNWNKFLRYSSGMMPASV